MLPIERAHRLALLLLRLAGAVPGGRWLLDRCFALRDPALEREVFGLRFRNPVGLAAGFDVNGEAFREFGAMGFGFVEVGTVTPRPQSGNPRPRIFRLRRDCSIINRIGLANRGLARMIQHLRHEHPGVVVGCNIGRNITTSLDDAPADYQKCFRNLYQYADYFTVNLCCDNASRDGAAHSREHILRLLDPLFDFRRGQNHYRPIMLKISPDLTDGEIDTISDILVETPLDGIVAVNGTHGREGLKTSFASITAIGGGRLSGTVLKQRTLDIVRRIHARSGGAYPIIAAGGIQTAEDVREMMEAGADLVQIYTGLVYEGPRIVRTICRGLIAETPAAEAEPTSVGGEQTDPAAPADPAAEAVESAPASAEGVPAAEDVEIRSMPADRESDTK